MGETLQDTFVVFAVDEPEFAHRHQADEHAVAICPSHEEAIRVRQEFRGMGTRCVTRCVSETGGGD